MIASLTGTILKIEDDALVVNLGGLGLRVLVPSTVLENTGGTGRQITLHTHLIVRETELTLYGFSTEEAQNLFETLMGVSGVGPKVALAMLSTLSPEMLKSALAREETAVLQRVPGIGKKTAEKIMFQLRDKIDFTAPESAAALVTDNDAEVIAVLTSLGFSIVEAQGALQKIPRDVDSVEERVQTALQYLGQ